MNDLLNAIQSCIKSNEYYGALVISLMIPSIAAAACSVNNRDTGIGYAKWFDEHVALQPTTFTGDDCFKLRCKLLHQGVSTPDNLRGYQSPYTNIVFTLPSPVHFSGNQVINENDGTHTLDIDILDFCTAITVGGKSWLHSVAQDEEIMKRLLTTVQRRNYNIFGGIEGLDKEAIW